MTTDSKPHDVSSSPNGYTPIMLAADHHWPKRIEELEAEVEFLRALLTALVVEGKKP